MITGFPDNIVMIEYDPIESNGVILFKKVRVGDEFADMIERPKILSITKDSELKEYNLVLKSENSREYLYVIDAERVKGRVVNKYD